MGKKAKQLFAELREPRLSSAELLDDFNKLTSRDSQLRQWRAHREKERLELEKQVADLLDIDVDWSPERERWYLFGQLPLSADDDAAIGLFDPLNDASIAIRILSSFYLATENVPGSFLVAGISRSGRRCSARTEGNEVIEVICRVAVDLNR